MFPIRTRESVRARWALIAMIVLSGCSDPAPEPEPAEPSEAPPDETESESAPAPEREPPANREEALAILRAMTDGPRLSLDETEGVSVTLSATPDRVTMSERSRVALELRLTNEGTRTHGAVGVSHWTVNGVADGHLYMTFVNGSRVGDWESFPPGRILGIDREGVFEEFESPGAYVLTYEYGALRADARVIVMADDPAERGVAWWLEADPADLTMAQRGDFRLKIFVTNTGTEVRDPEQHRGSWTVNDEASGVIDMAFGNGLREAVWGELPPGGTAEMQRALGESLFEAPGEYVIRYVREDGTAAGVNVLVRE